MGCRVRHLIALTTLAALASAGQASAAPTARDFEQPLGGVERVRGKAAGHEGEGPVTHRSPVIEAPAAFDAVGLAGEMRPVELRVRPAGGEWTSWLEVGNGDPLFAVGGADEVQLRTRGWRPRGMLHYVELTTGTDENRTDDGSGERQSAKQRGSTDEVPKPRFIRRDRWGANRASGGCPPATSPSHGVVKAVVVHHTVTSNTYSRSEAKGIVLAICRYHRYGNGWNDIGYNALVDRFGRLYEGRAGGLRKSVVGAHAAGYNAQTAGIAAIGNHSSAAIARKARGKTARYAAWKHSINGHRSKGQTTLVSRGGASNRYPSGTRIKTERIIGHRRVGATACPGDALARELRRIRNRAQRIQDKHETG